MNRALLSDMVEYIKKIDDSMHTIDLNKYMLLNGIVFKRGLPYGEYIKIDEKHRLLEFYHIGIKFNNIIETNMLTRKIDNNVQPLYSEYISSFNDLNDIKEKLLHRIAKYFTINEFSKIGISPKFIDKNFKYLLENRLSEIKGEIFNQNLPKFYLNALDKCNNMDCIYKVYKKKRKDVKYILESIL